MNISALLAPLSDHAPCGVDLREDVGHNSLYFRLKDARGQARAAEREAEMSGEAIPVPAAWATVHGLAAEALSRHSKDVEIAAWLLEALARANGYAGLADGFTLVDGLIERYWPALHAPDRETPADILAPLAGLNGAGAEGPLVQAIRMVPLVPSSSYGSHSLWHHTQAERNPNGDLNREFVAARAAAGTEAMRKRAGEARDAEAALAKLTSRLDGTCGEDAPSTAKIRAVLEEVRDAYRLMLGGDVREPEPAPQPAPVAHGAVQAAAPPHVIAVAPPEALQPVPPRELRTREDAFSDLLRIADFFRRTEPHSPISYALETLVRRGRMELVDLLAELLPDASSRLQFLVHAGIQATTDSAAKKP